jgi:hypothetical protein
MNCIAKWDFHLDCEYRLRQALTGPAPELLDQAGSNFLNREPQHETECGCEPKAVASPPWSAGVNKWLTYLE